MRYFLDFDRTLFDTDAFIRHLRSRSDFLPSDFENEDVLAKTLHVRAESGALTFAPGELTPFVYADVSEFLRALGNEATIVTYGNQALQRLKVQNALAHIPRVSALYTGAVRKGPFLAKSAGTPAGGIFVDDTQVELQSVVEYCPHMRVYEMRRDGGKSSGPWPAVRSLYDLP